jgi:hypothetical protein
MIPFEEMDEQEQRHHIEEIHGILYLRGDALAIQHTEDHERLDYDHDHDDDATCEGYGPTAPLNDRTCSVCGDRYGSQEPPGHPLLCPYHAVVIDRQTKAAKEEEDLGWFE